MKWTTENIPDMTGKVCIVTGANTGLGYEVTLQLATKGAEIVMAVRSLERGQAAIARIEKAVPNAKISIIKLDLSSLDSIKEATEEIRTMHKKVDIIVNNAGVISKPKQTTRDGFEMNFGVNHLGHFAFTLLLLDIIVATPNSRIVTVSSITHRKAKPALLLNDLDCKGLGTMQLYRRSKFANLLFAYELQRRLQGTNTISVAAHPGIAQSEIVRGFPKIVQKLANLYMQRTSVGALPILRAATDPAILGGQYWGPRGRKEHRGHPTIVTSSDATYDIGLQKLLWLTSEELTNVKLDPQAIRDE